MDEDYRLTGEAVPGMDMDAYHAAPGVSKTDLDRIARCPARYRYDKGHPEDRQDTPQMALGRAVHARVLEPERFRTDFVPAPRVDLRTRAGKEEMEQFKSGLNGQTVLSADVYEQTQEIGEAVEANCTAMFLFRWGGQAEVSLFAEDAGIIRKARPDWIRHNNIPVDLKTSSDASESAFSRSCATWRYHVQAAWYLDTMAMCGIEPAADLFVFAVVETAPPYLMAFYSLGQREIALGRELYQKNLDTYRKCVRTGTWPGYGEEIKRLSLPAWAMKREEEGLI